MILHSQNSVRGDAADGNGVQSPLPENSKDFLFPALLGDQKHALLRFREHDLIRSHAGFTLRNILQVDLDAGLRAASHFASGARKSGRAHVLDADDRPSLHRFQTCF